MLFLLYGYNSQAQCPSTVTISGLYATTYTGSNTWIASSGSTTIPTGANVTLDANPTTNGYVLLDVGFETQPNATFLAIVQTSCTLLGIDENELVSTIAIYPNPTNAVLNLSAKSKIISTQITDINGRVIQTLSQNNTDVILNIENLKSGLYLLKITTENGSFSEKIIKN